jgi:hypothetical protein
MARFLKNPDLSPNSIAARLPIVPSSAYGDAPIDGLIRYNNGNSKIEFFYNNTWNQIAKVGTVNLVVDEFVGDGTTTGPFLMSQSESADSSVLVTIGGVYQQPTTHYYVVGYQIWFTSPPPAPGINPNKIVVVHNINSTNAA